MRIQFYLLIWLLSLISMVATAQQYATSQTRGVTGICLLCGVTNPDNPVNNASLDDYSSFSITIGLLGVTVYQTLIFPVAGTAGCDSLVIGIGSDNTVLSVNMVSGVSVQTFNGGIANNDAQVVDNNNARFYGNNRGEIFLRPTQTFDRVKITLTSNLIGLLNGFRLYHAYRKPATATPVVADSTAICARDTATLTATAATGATIRWYDAANGGNLLFTGNIYRVSPAVTTTYYAAVTLNGCTSLRKAVKVIVHPRPADPVYSVPSGYLCRDAQLLISNHRNNINYRVNVRHTGLFGLILDTSYLVTGSNTITIKDIAYFFNTNTAISIQAVDAITGCTSDTIRQAIVYGGHAAPADVEDDSVTICKGDSVTLRGWLHNDPDDMVAIIRWYDAPSGGKLLFTGKRFTVRPLVTTSYYVVAAHQCEYPVRTRVTVVVRKLDDPVFTVPQGIVCGDTKIKVENHRQGYTYRVVLKYSTFTGPLFDTAFTVSNTNIISTSGYTSILPALVDIYVQARDPLTGCRSDTIHKFFNVGGASTLPSTDADSVGICRGDSVTLHAFVPIFDLSIIRWYNAPTGGNLLFTGNYYKVSPAQSTTYYVTAGYECEYPKRRPVKVTVNSCAASFATKQQLLQTLQIAPNPTTGNIWFNTTHDLTNSLIMISNIYGAVVQREIYRGNRMVLSSALGNGVYFVRIVKGSGEVYSTKIILQR